MVNDVTYGPEWCHSHEVRLHETAGGFFRVFEVALNGLAVAGGNLRQNFLLIARFEVFDYVSGVIGIKIRDGLGQHAIGERF